MVIFSMRERTQPAFPSLVRTRDQSSRCTGATGAAGSGGLLCTTAFFCSSSTGKRVLDNSSQFAGKAGGGPLGGGGKPASFLSFSDFFRLGMGAGFGGGGSVVACGAT